MQSVSMVRESIMPSAIQNCFAECGCSVASLISDDDDEENCE
jgi:hypothetical protein